MFVVTVALACTFLAGVVVGLLWEHAARSLPAMTEAHLLEEDNRALRSALLLVDNGDELYREARSTLIEEGHRRG